MLKNYFIFYKIAAEKKLKKEEKRERNLMMESLKLEDLLYRWYAILCQRRQ